LPSTSCCLYNALARPGYFDEGGFAWTASVSFIQVIRLFDTPSAPLLTPTYEPRAKVQLFEVLRLGEDDVPGRRFAPRGLGALELGLGHRSNGQDGCALTDHVRIPGHGNDFDCIALTSPPSNTLNLHDGSFTTNYLLANLRAKLLVPAAGGGPIQWSATAGAGIEWNLPCGFDACMPFQMRDRYGPVIFRWQAEGELVAIRDRSVHLFGVGQVPLDASVRATLQGAVHLGAKRPAFSDFSAEVAFVPRDPRGPGVGLFLRVHHGSDYLNIRFEHQFNALLFGAVIDPAPLERIGERRQ
jgi:hypothetical protein